MKEGREKERKRGGGRGRRSAWVGRFLQQITVPPEGLQGGTKSSRNSPPSYSVSLTCRPSRHAREVANVPWKQHPRVQAKIKQIGPKPSPGWASCFYLQKKTSLRIHLSTFRWQGFIW